MKPESQSKGPQEDGEDVQEAPLSLAAAQETSLDAAVGAVSSEVDHINEHHEASLLIMVLIVACHTNKTLCAVATQLNWQQKIWLNVIDRGFVQSPSKFLLPPHKGSLLDRYIW